MARKRKKKETENFLAGYIPASQPIDPQTSFRPIDISKVDVPPYDDPGVSYKGFSKVYQNGAYKLLKQIPYKLCTIVTLNAVSNPDINFSHQEGYDVYITSAIFSIESNNEASNGYIIRIQDGETAGNLIILRCLEGVTYQEMYFNPPLKINSDIWVVELSEEPSPAGEGIFNFYGYEEQRP